ncbi:MAG: gliding motility-associated C-terminal domain-containing protein [Chitinophagaceae bacterium]
MKKQVSLLTVSFLLYLVSSGQLCSTLPDNFFPDDTLVVCNGTNYQLNAPAATAVTYTWSSGEVGNSIAVGVNSKYWLRIEDGGTCVKTDTIVILFNSFLLSPEINDLKLCKGQPARPLPVRGQNLLWYKDPIGGIGNPVMPVPSTIDTGRTTYWFSQTTRGCESPRLPMLVKTIDKPKFDLGDAFIIPCNTLGIVLQVVEDGESNYTWSNGSNEVAMVAATRGEYSLYAENMCGNYRDTTVGVECEDKCVQFPNAFTPNGDGKNEEYKAAVFCPVPKYKLVIYNRNGELVYKTSDPKSGWNGYYNGKVQPLGAYIYYAEFFDFVLKSSFTEKGTFVLVR